MTAFQEEAVDDAYAVPTRKMIARAKKVLQTSKEWNDLWNYYCDSSSDGQRDPAQQTRAFVKVFLEEYDRAKVADGASPTGNVAEADELGASETPMDPEPEPQKEAPERKQKEESRRPTASSAKMPTDPEPKPQKEMPEHGKKGESQRPMALSAKELKVRPSVAPELSRKLGGRDCPDTEELPKRQRVWAPREFGLSVFRDTHPGPPVHEVYLRSGRAQQPRHQDRLPGCEPSGGAGHRELVERVKQLQGQHGELVMRAWHRACDEHGSGIYDPTRHPPDFLRDFLQEADELISGTADLVKQVKLAQRGSVDVQEAWHTLCDEEGGGIRDPKRHEAWFLRRFLDDFESGAFGTKKPAEDLIARVKAAQRTSPDIKESWHSFCDAEGCGMYDPRRYGDDFLLRFLDQTGFGKPARAKRRRRKRKEMPEDADSADTAQGEEWPEGKKTGEREQEQVRGGFEEQGADEEDLRPEGQETKEAEDRRLAVRGLTPDTTDADLEEHFARYGDILEAYVLSPSMGQQHGTGFVTLASAADVEAALQDDHEILGQSVQVKLHMLHRNSPLGSEDGTLPSKRRCVSRTPLKFRGFQSA
eukprot:CAMPEP_0179102390 /NCGR_PEP_ID=MMETSP0796-20121207/47388_1 /TAXON_ID=73915 /ORGANISM="Pyrodinium bahamense, Strain pbaha01" /LENGTH=588 /DNA_ID=CAMNT_0020800265 /DNA_START=55 /DNA_END=1821 /DNA_ORIENTATION=+